MRVGVPFADGEEGTKRGDGTVWGEGGDRVERAEVHEGDCIGVGEVRAGEVGVEARCDGRREDGPPGGLGGCADGGDRAGLEGRAEAVVERVVGAWGFGDDDHFPRGEEVVRSGGGAVADKGVVVAARPVEG